MCVCVCVSDVLDSGKSLSENTKQASNATPSMQNGWYTFSGTRAPTDNQSNRLYRTFSSSLAFGAKTDTIDGSRQNVMRRKLFIVRR